MAKKKAQKRKSGNKKHGRSKEKCLAYKARGQRERNKLRKLHKHVRKHPNDKAAWETIKGFSK